MLNKRLLTARTQSLAQAYSCELLPSPGLLASAAPFSLWYLLSSPPLPAPGPAGMERECSPASSRDPLETQNSRNVRTGLAKSIF